MFPQLIAGPIVRYQDVALQMQHRKHDVYQFAQGVQRFVSGLCKKVLLANNIGLVWNRFRAAGNSPRCRPGWALRRLPSKSILTFPAIRIWPSAWGRMLGFSFPMNFDYPYTSQSVSEFWRRWHMTLGTWFREYVYIPLGATAGFAPHGVQFARGVDAHGPVAWCKLEFFAVGIVLRRSAHPGKAVLGRWLQRLPAALRHAYTMLCVLVGWVLFSFESLPAIGRYLRAMCFWRAALGQPGGIQPVHQRAVVDCALRMCDAADAPCTERALCTARRASGRVGAVYSAADLLHCIPGGCDVQSVFCISGS